MGWPPLARREHRPSAGLLRFATPTPTPVFQPGGGAAMSRVAGVPDRLQAPAAQSLAGLYRFGSGVRPTRRRLVDVGPHHCVGCVSLNRRAIEAWFVGRELFGWP